MAPLPWDQISAVLFDLDGTLYDQKKLRQRFLPRLGLHVLSRADLKLLKIISALRHAREALADGEISPFQDKLIADVAAKTGASPERVRAVLEDWLQTRPLPYLAPAKVPGVEAVFAALRASNRPIAVLSDYPAKEKLAALGLRADLVLAATDPEIAIQKPNPRGIEAAAAHFGLAPSALLVIGDREERDGQAAKRAGAPALIRGRDFERFDEPLFDAIPPLAGPGQ
ncbi:MAG: HAD family hydrolase [Mangrovicoccus sp.]|nr:HAD family hydrolase [Mangrovicoccus sp.]